MDIITLSKDSHIIDTNLAYQTAPYVVFKLDNNILGFSFAEHHTLYSVYDTDKLRITLPVENAEQTVIPYDGLWTVSLYNFREAERQSLSKALKPKADL